MSESIGTDDQRPKVGRKRDFSRDDAIVRSALELLAELGYHRLTMDLVATRASVGKATIYRRWSSKSELVLEAVVRMKSSQIDLQNLPDTGSLREDLMSLFKPLSTEESQWRTKVMTGLASLLAAEAELSEAGTAALVEPWAAVHRALMLRARDRGEVEASADIEAVCQVVPRMAAYRALVERKAFDKDFLIGLLDGVVLPALGGWRELAR